MGRNNGVKFIILATGVLTSVGVTSKAIACEDEQIQIKSLQNLESLAPEQRIHLRDRINWFLQQNPNFDMKNYQFGVDKEGDIYVLDKSQIPADKNGVVAAPSCITQ
jgi:hypothetical protein